MSQTTSPPRTPPQASLSRRGVATRLALSSLALLLLLYGTFFGSDSDFPFGPFRMYATRNAPDGTVNSLRLEGVTSQGETVPISAGSLGLRRAELEGSLPRMKDEPELMEEMAQRYAVNNPDLPQLVELQVVVRVYQLRDGKETGEYEDRIEAVWKQP
ncbi:hypothetical protein [Blastococcus sp. Marseille-P5729]|uniref:hypothetical protein n=1 Tax=Blastococcus sp. Marseille-P5729 TaxID=2086582 RepID=UPI000D0F361E|nr:hypothetical protein [Blastococcus sp. Marseille-P5729]